MRRDRWLVAAVAAMFCVAPVKATEVPVKSLSGPPDEFSAMRLPAAEALVVSSNILVIDPVGAVRDGDTQARVVAPPGFDTSPGVGFSVVQVTTAYPYFHPVVLVSPGGAVYRFNGSSLSCNAGPCADTQADLRIEAMNNSAGGVMSLSVSGGEVVGGSWSISVQAPPVHNAAQVETIVAFDYNIVETWVDPCPGGFHCDVPCDPASQPGFICPIAVAPGLNLVEGQPVALGVGFSKGDDRDAGSRLPAVLESVRIRIQDESSGREVFLDTLAYSEVASLPTTRQGFPLVHLPALPAGRYAVRLDVAGTAEGIGRIERTAFHSLPILEQRHRILDRVSVEPISRQRLQLNIALESQAGASGHVYAYAELWSGDGNQPIAWIGGMTHPKSGPDGSLMLPMVLDTRWLSLHGVDDRSLRVRNLRIQDPDTFTPLDQRAELTLQLDTAALGLSNGSLPEMDETLYVGHGDITIPATLEAPATTDQPVITGGPIGTPLLLVHGWCSNPIWPQWQFTRGPTGVFNDANQSRSHDTFAQLIRNQGDAQFADQYAIVAHSQGGAAATHLRAFYVSRLDNSTAPRRIQTMGTPFRGSTLMDLYVGTNPLSFLIAEIFGFCGQQFSLTTLGSALWLTSIPNWVRNDVFYHRTRHALPGNFWQSLQFWRWRCNAASFVIPGHDDGVVSIDQGFLSGGNNLGITNSQCHTGGMNHPSQVTDAGRNAVMDERGRSFTCNLARNATASASSTYCASSGLHCYSPARANDGDRSTALGGFTSWTNNSTTMPQWWQLSWPTTITAGRVEVYTSAGYPIADYDIQRWTGSSWQNIVSVRGNTALHRIHTFPAITTSALRVNGLRGPSNQPQYVRLNEVEVCR